jgi:hypothetical protein
MLEARNLLSTFTIAGNYAGEGLYGGGGGIYNAGPLTVSNSTIAGNYAGGGIDGPGDGGGISNSFLTGTLHARNTIIAGNHAGYGPDLDGNLGSLGHNLTGNTQGGNGFHPTDLLNVDPHVGPLQDNGGPTQTMALMPGSPALNAGDPSQLGVPDQRGVVRSGGVNIGAYQASASGFVVSAPDMVQAGVPFDVTVMAVDPFNQVAVGFTGTVTFSTTDQDPSVVLPADYAFTLDDGGSHTFTDTGLGETTLITPGDQMLTVMDTADNTIMGSATITVSNAPPSPGTHWPGNVVWLPPRLMLHRCGESEPLESYWLDSADFVRG